MINNFTNKTNQPVGRQAQNRLSPMIPAHGCLSKKKALLCRAVD